MDTAKIARNMSIDQNITIRVLDKATGEVVSSHTGHNQATNAMLLGIAHYLKGDGTLNQANSMLNDYIPRYISLGTMGLTNQDETSDGLPAGIGVNSRISGESDELYDERRYEEYKEQQPGYGANGYDTNRNNGRPQLGLGAPYSGTGDAVKCELISSTFPRSKITYRQIIPETESETPETIDLVFSAMISTGALAQFRGNRDYIFITEAGLWSRQDYSDSSDNGLLAGYRIMPSDKEKWDMSIAENRAEVDQSIIRVGVNQVVQVIWKLEIGAPYDLLGEVTDMRNYYTKLQTDDKFATKESMQYALKYRGEVATFDDLPDIATVDRYDLYKVVDTGVSYFKWLSTDTSWSTLYDASGTGSGVGESTTGQEFVYNETTYTSGTGAERFNDYQYNLSIGQYSHAEGGQTASVGDYSHAEGGDSAAVGNYSHAEGALTVSSGTASHAEGNTSISSGTNSHAEGQESVASGQACHAEGSNTIASGTASHAEGMQTESAGSHSHAGGTGSVATGDNSFAHGQNVNTSNAEEVAFGRYNSSSTNTLFSIGNGTGTSSSDRSNAIEVKTNGDAIISGTYTDGTGHVLIPYVQMTKAQYDALATKENVVYFITN